MDQENIASPQSSSKNVWIRILVIAVSILILAAVAGIFYRMGRNSAGNEMKQPKDISQGIKEKQPEAEKPAGLTEENNKTNLPNEAKSNHASGISLPVVTFIPSGLFTDGEKEELENKIINPYADYMKENENRESITITVHKYSEEEISKMVNYARYTYNIEVITADGYAGWLAREAGKPIEYWIPDCMGECVFSQSYEKKYPEVIAKYRKEFNQQL